MQVLDIPLARLSRAHGLAPDVEPGTGTLREHLGDPLVVFCWASW